jgi:exosortase A-associated hydrolase 1
MSFSEQALIFPCAGEKLLGIIAVPEQPGTTGVLIVVGGPQYRVGSHRQFLLLSRALAEAGYPTMRFDYRGMGDSSGQLGSFDAINEDVGAALEAFRMRYPFVERFVLWGLCDAASAVLLYWHATHDPRVVGLVLLNPWVRSTATLARTQIKHYYGQRLLQREFWLKLVHGQVGITKAMRGFFRSILIARSGSRESKSPVALPYQHRMADAARHFPGRILLLLSGNDYTAKEFLEMAKSNKLWQEAIELSIERRDLEAADHTFSTGEWRGQVIEWVIDWLSGLSTTHQGYIQKSA